MCGSCTVSLRKSTNKHSSKHLQWQDINETPSHESTMTSDFYN